METLFAIAITVGVLKAHAAPPPEPRAAVAGEHREVKVEKSKVEKSTPRMPQPSLGF
jgi:hypothetical protein